MVKPWSIAGAVRFPQALAAGRGATMSAPALAADDLAFLQYTGGTTGVSKGAMLQHRHVLSNVEQILAYTGNTVRAGQEVAIAPLPFYHILALVLNCMMFVRGGGLQILIANPRDIPNLVKTLGAQPVHVLRRRQHPVQRARPQRRTSPRSTSATCAWRAAAARRCSSRWPSAGRRSPGACCPRATD